MPGTPGSDRLVSGEWRIWWLVDLERVHALLHRAGAQAGAELHDAIGRPGNHILTAREVQ